MNVSESAEWICSQAEHVYINGLEDKARELYECIKTAKYSKSHWRKHELNRVDLNWIFLIDLLNFSFWDGFDEPLEIGLKQFTVQGKTGYWSLCAAVNRALDDGIPVTEPSWMANCSFKDVQKIFKPDKGCKQVPMLVERHELIKRAGQILETHSFESMVLSANQSAQQLIKTVITNFGDIFDDSLVYKSKKVCFHKRVQILVADIWACFEGIGIGTFHDIDTVTMFADYRVPQILVYLGILTYSPDLNRILKNHEEYHTRGYDCGSNQKNLMPRGDQLEVEIRAASIHSVELLVAKIKELQTDPSLEINAVILDFYLWDLAKSKGDSISHIPIHRTRSIFY